MVLKTKDSAGQECMTYRSVVKVYFGSVIFLSCRERRPQTLRTRMLELAACRENMLPGKHIQCVQEGREAFALLPLPSFLPPSPLTSSPE